MKKRFLYLTVVVLLSGMLNSSAHAVTFRMYWDAARSTCTLDGVTAGQQLEMYLFAEGTGNIAGAAVHVWQLPTNTNPGSYQFLQVHWPADATVWGEFSEWGGNRGMAMTFPCQPMPKLIARIDVLITSQPSCLSWTKTATVSGTPDEGQHLTPVALTCHLTTNPDNAGDGRSMLVINPDGQSSCQPCNIPVAAESSTWGGIKAQYK